MHPSGLVAMLVLARQRGRWLRWHLWGRLGRLGQRVRCRLWHLRGPADLLAPAGRVGHLGLADPVVPGILFRPRPGPPRRRMPLLPHGLPVEGEERTWPLRKPHELRDISWSTPSALRQHR